MRICAVVNGYVLYQNLVGIGPVWDHHSSLMPTAIGTSCVVTFGKDEWTVDLIYNSMIELPDHWYDQAAYLVRVSA